MITAAKLRARTVKDLATMARRKGVTGWHSMRKEELVKALLKCAKTRTSGGGNSRSGKPGKSSSDRTGGVARSIDGRYDSGREPRSRQDSTILKRVKKKLAQAKDLARKVADENKTPVKDRLVIMVRDPYWLHAYWELTSRSIERARAAMGQYWHGARPMLRLWEVTRNGTTSSARKSIRDIEIHGGVNNWYVDVQDPPKSFQMDIGYLAAGGRFFSLARSNVVSTCVPKNVNSVDGNWSDVARDFDRIYAMSGGYAADGDCSDLKEVFEKQLRRPMGSPMTTRFGLGAKSAGCDRSGFTFEVDAEMVVFGATEPGAHVTLKGQPIRLKEDGTFVVRFALPNRRQVLPVVASSGDGVEQRTIVLAVERNTKMMEPVIREPNE